MESTELFNHVYLTESNGNRLFFMLKLEFMLELRNYFDKILL